MFSFVSDNSRMSNLPPTQLALPGPASPEGNSGEDSRTQTRSWQSVLARCAVFPFVYWNWKTAAINAGIRGSMFLVAAGRHGGSKGAVVEIIYVVFNTGFFCAIQQGLLGVRPRWAGNLGIVVGVPVTAQAGDYLVHILAKAPNPSGFTVGMLFFSWLSAMFHLHVMESGTMLMGNEGRSFLSDLKAIPGLVVSFVCAPFLWVATVAKGVSRVEWETGAAD